MKLPLELKTLTDLERLEKENAVLRGIIANSNMNCVYCGLSKDDMSKCGHGFPGCERADDMINDPNWSPEIGNVTP